MFLKLRNVGVDMTRRETEKITNDEYNRNHDYSMSYETKNFLSFVYVTVAIVAGTNWGARGCEGGPPRRERGV